ncbi:MAG: hypothetical protein QXO84_02385 [Candidatus Aenigmatarchaeota archaeon]
MSTKAQIFSSDFIFASFIFILAISITYYLWMIKMSDLEEEKSLNKITDHARIVSNVWMREGIPKYWNDENVIDLGLHDDGRLNETKMNYLKNLSYSKVKSMLGLNEYEFFLRIYDVENRTKFEFGKLEKSKMMVKVKRVSIMEGGIVFIETILWSK